MVVKKLENVVLTTEISDTTQQPTDIKSKRGRKSKKELLNSLKMEQIGKLQKEDKNIILQVKENKPNDIEINDIETPMLSCNNDNLVNETLYEILENTEEKKTVIKKRGRKPKGGKIIQQIMATEKKEEDKPNVILHLKCFLRDLQNNNHEQNLVESYNFMGNKNEFNYEIISNSVNCINKENTCQISNSNNDYEEDDDSENNTNNKEIWKKLKQLEYNLHTNNINNKRSSCFWDTCEFDNPPIHIPKHFINNSYNVYGCFCSPECAVAYLMNENIDSSTKFERYHLLNHIYTKVYSYKKNIKPAPNPYYMLEKYYGNLSIQEYRSLLRNERLFLIVDKPLTRILPELHEDNDDFILNNKIIPSNNYNIKSRLQKKKPDKVSILNERFGITN
jgi:hypothetical protein